MSPVSVGSRQHGATLVELLFGTVLGLFLMVGVVHLFMSGSRTYMIQDALSRIQENGRFALDLIGQDIRMAGFTGCPTDTDLANPLSTTTDARAWMTHFDKGLTGIPLANKSRIDSNALSEAIIVYKLDMESAYPITAHNTTEALITSAAGHDFDSGDVVAAVGMDCKQVSVFKAGRNTTTTVVSHESTTSTGLVNRSALLGGHYNANDGLSGAVDMSHEGSELIAVSSVAYYLRESNGLPNLYRKFAGETASGNAIATEAILEGIERMSVLYGYDADQDGLPDQYLTAAQIGLFSHNWRNVMSVRMELLVRSLQEIMETPQTYIYRGLSIVPDDRFLRRSFIMTVKIRNRYRQ